MQQCISLLNDVNQRTLSSCRGTSLTSHKTVQNMFCFCYREEALHRLKGDQAQQHGTSPTLLSHYNDGQFMSFAVFAVWFTIEFCDM